MVDFQLHEAATENRAFHFIRGIKHKRRGSQQRYLKLGMTTM